MQPVCCFPSRRGGEKKKKRHMHMSFQCCAVLGIVVFATFFIQVSLATGIDALLQQAKTAFSSGKYAEALDSYSKALSVANSPASGTSASVLMSIYAKRGEVLYLSKKYDAAIADFERAEDRVGADYLPKLYLLLGKVEEGLRKYPFDPKLTSLSNSLKRARQLCSPDRPQEALSDGLLEYARILAVARESDALRLERAVCALRADDIGIVREETNKILGRKSEHTASGRTQIEALMVLGRALINLGSIDSALQNFKRVLKLDPDHKDAKLEHKRLRDMLRHHSEGQQAFAEQRFGDALKSFLQAQRAEPHAQMALQLASAICDCHVKLKDADAALESCSLAEALDTSTVDPILFRAEAFILKDDLDSALREFQRAREKSPNDQRPMEGISKVQRLQRMASRKDLYKVIGVPKTASEKEIKKAYRKLASKLHPDKAPEGKQAEYETKFRELNDAYEILTDQEKRRKYDAGEDFEQQHQPGGHGGFGHPGFNPFGDNFGGGFGGGQQHFSFRFG
eukprot:ANDGO_04431.mRNA.1 DnaJ homolog subfamily C member 3 homolog